MAIFIINNMKKIITEGTKKDNRKRNWTFVLYPESAPENWRLILDDLHIQWIESPLHDKDKNPDGTFKKPHWHIALLFEGNKSYNQIKDITDTLVATIPQVAQSVKGLVRYFIHLDNPEKYQYEKSKIISHGGADLFELLKPTCTNRYEMIKDMIDYIYKNEITEFMSFMLYCSQERFQDWFPLLCDSSSFVIDKAIKSNRHRPKVNRKIDTDHLAALI